jgi:hypothetical protein
MRYKIEPWIGHSTGNIYYHVYRRRWFWWEDLGGMYARVEEAEEAIKKLSMVKYIEVGDE